MKLEVSEQFVKEAHKSACKDWKKRIEEQFPSLFEVKLEAGKWYKSSWFDGVWKKIYVRFKERDVDGIIGDGFDANGCYEEEATFGKRQGVIWELATSEEIESMLWKEAEKRGIGKNTKIEKSLTQITDKCSNDGGYAICYDYNYDELWNKNGCIYKQGKFAIPLDTNKEIKATIQRLETEIQKLKESIL